MEVNSPASTAQPSTTQPLTQSLSGQGECQAERQERQHNGNVPPWLREQKKTGAWVDELCAKLVIKHIEWKDSGADATYYYCIGCDSHCANNSCSQALPHAKSCHVCIISSYLTLRDFRYLFCSSNYHQTLQREWPKEWNSVTNALVEMTTEHIAFAVLNNGFFIDFVSAL